MKLSGKRGAAAIAIFASLAALAGCGGSKESAPPSAAKVEPAPSETAPATQAQASIENAAAAAEASEPIAASGPDPVHGKRVFAKCAVCHSTDEGRNGAGPSLFKVVGANAGHVAGFKYSDAMANSGIVWTGETLSHYLENPAKFVPGNIMAFPGLPSETDRADLIAYLQTIQ